MNVCPRTLRARLHAVTMTTFVTWISRILASGELCWTDTSAVTRATCIFHQIVSTNNDTVIKSAVVFCLDTGLFGGESFVVYPATPGQTIHIPINPPSNTTAELRVQVRATCVC